MEDLSHLSCNLKNNKDSNILVGFSGNEDAGIYKISDELALVQSADFITPLVNDPYTYGQIAAANSLSDIYAMGGEVKTALNLLMWDSCHLDSQMISEVLEGGLSKIKEAGGVLLGGHTIGDKEQKYGLSVTGIIHPQKIWRNNTGQIGDCLILTKPIGMGILTTALKADMLDSKVELKISQIMATLNQKATKIASKYTIHACTDITGYGLLGHLYEMTNPKISIKLYSNQIPLLQEAIEFAKMGIIPGGSHSNQKAINPYCHFALPLDSLYLGLEILLFDAQTSGGLVFATPYNQAQSLLNELKNEGIDSAQIIGEIIPANDSPINIV
nr:selenide, water dikinase SelD [Helicobacter colisuis]